jgi:hypothetical protein
MAFRRLSPSFRRLGRVRWWLGLVVSAAVLVGVDTQSVGATPLWTINFTGSGSSKSDATLSSEGGACPTTDTSTVDTTFTWTVTFHHVTLSMPPVTGPITGVLSGTADETDSVKVSGGCKGTNDCDRHIDFHADESSDGEQPAALLFKKAETAAPGPQNGTDTLVVDLQASAEEEAQCESQDPNDQGFFFAGQPGSFGPAATDALAASVQLPVSEIRHSGKIIVLANKGAFNYPRDSDCGDPDLGLKCTHSQDWSGRITMTRGG